MIKAGAEVKRSPVSARSATEGARRDVLHQWLHNRCSEHIWSKGTRLGVPLGRGRESRIRDSSKFSDPEAGSERISESESEFVLFNSFESYLNEW